MAVGLSARRVGLSLSLLAALCGPLAAASGSAASGPSGTIAVTIGADLWTVSADGTQRTRLTRDGRSHDASWSADGSSACRSFL